jgi:peptidoglycan/xylan/chitin deacetylase (PgdA/CDA1 family)
MSERARSAAFRSGIPEMKTSSIVRAATAKGPLALVGRVWSIARRYGITPAKMDRALRHFAQILRRFDCGATFPLTTVTLQRNSDSITRYMDHNIEFIVHGYTHTDYSQLGLDEQLAHLRRARETFAKLGIMTAGFRSPYLRRDENLYAAIEAVGFSYVSNQPVMWDVSEADVADTSTSAGFVRAIDFYDPWFADVRPSLPKLYNGLVEIPVSLPDDEILLDRLGAETGDLIQRVWCRILSETYQRGELFTVQLHPERITLCADGLSAVLAEARRLRPRVWLARLDEIAAWWQARKGANVEIADAGDGAFRLTVTGPSGTTVLARSVQVDVPTDPWADDYHYVEGTAFTVRAPVRPFIGLSPAVSSQLLAFLQQQGYITEVGQVERGYAYYFDQTEFTPGQERALMAEIEGTDRPLVRLGRWPNRTRSAVAITGDIDALTLWDYVLRFLGR